MNTKDDSTSPIFSRRRTSLIVYGRILLIGVGVLFLIYAISFGPVLALTADLSRDERMGQFLAKVYRPHIALMYYSKGYWIYANLWDRLGGVSGSHQAFREYYEETRDVSRED